jgi:Protein of unknown function DUF86
MSGFRNVLVHRYLAIDRRRVYKALRDDLRDFERFIRAVSKLLLKPGLGGPSHVVFMPVERRAGPHVPS